MRNSSSNPLKQFITDGQINIPQSEWCELKSTYTEKDIQSWFTHEIINEKSIDIPYRKYDLEEIKALFRTLCTYDITGLHSGDVYSRYEYKSKLEPFYFEGVSTFNPCSDYFHHEARFLCDSINAPSPYRVWNSESFLQGVLKALFTLKCDHVNMATLRTALGMRKYIASQFKCTLVREIISHFNARSVLDPCAGWGDRLLGFCSLPNTTYYVGIDPNKRLFDAYAKQIELYEEITPYKGKQIQMLNACAEDISSDFLKNIYGKFDMVLTSPPYFNTERYSQDDTQSFKRFKKLNDWLNGFLFKMIDLSSECVKQDGIVAINISDTYANHCVNHLCDPMCDYADSIGLKLIHVYGLKMASRVNSLSENKTKENRVFCEPLFVFQKR